jgi:hypothetical protein
MRPEKIQIQIITRTKVYIVIAILILAAIKTVISFPYVSKPCLLGYEAGCSFAPISTGILIFAVVITFFVAKRKGLDRIDS